MDGTVCEQGAGSASSLSLEPVSLDRCFSSASNFITARIAAVQFETATETFFRNVPFHPVDFATLEIEIQKAPAIIRGRFYFADRFFADRTSANRF
jgi:hypothetical protein